ncbi:hypothetical protein RPA26_03620 [Staphylococcus haemolyticus]|uniref:Uncharacterized protein n=2 Tax=Staphylococcus haemolyticus TaxID=1283 RepID=A0ABU3IEF4_STAHA|nr:hypothetical protein [Staphylococcus haemolyticus]AKC76369.1 acetyltransferase (GNAT) family protein [Staphylococcus haemolyticus]AUV67637.1 hypothetical protein CUZ62_07950 [Staphylococcus haemolyticus]AUV70015.1 hypothetical protein CYD28_07905 [Staphylococcus haemolyticus]MBE7361674.1 hypothetical protein [Staphylococcus haemolyticus]MBE7377445.1 hypothetical protein [Staphylococcus haemolyticus]
MNAQTSFEVSVMNARLKKVKRHRDKLLEEVKTLKVVNQTLKNEYEILAKAHKVLLDERSRLYDERRKQIIKLKSFNTFKKELLNDYPKLNERVKRYKSKWEENNVSWKLIDYYSQLGRLKQLAQILNYLDELDGTNKFKELIAKLEEQ